MLSPKRIGYKTRRHMEANPLNTALAAIPITILILTMLLPKLDWSAPRAGAVAWLAAAALALFVFGADERILAISSSKGLSLSLFVLTIIWASVMMYNVIEGMNGIEVIGGTITGFVRDPLAQALVVGWAFSGLIQGVAGFGLPIAVVAPLMVMMGFRPAPAVAITLVGHAWAVTFGSLGSSYYTIQLVSGIDGIVLGPQMAAMFALPTILTGFAVAHMQGGMASVRRGTPAILVVGAAMSLGLFAAALMGAYQIASVVASLAGCVVGWWVARKPFFKLDQSNGNVQPPSPVRPSEGQGTIGFHTAFLPYYLLFALSVLSQVPRFWDVWDDMFFGLYYPAFQTELGFAVAGQDAYAKINLASHPAPLIIASLLIAYVIYRARGVWRPGIIRPAIGRTYSQVISNSVGVATMVMMALVMTDTGMTALLGSAIAKGTGTLFPAFSPYIGVLGSFMTGSNTNSNAMFGTLQVETAASLGISAVVIAATQSIGGSLGSSVAMSKVAAGAAAVGLEGRERKILAKTLPYCLALALAVGVQAWVIIDAFPWIFRLVSDLLAR